MDLSKVNPEIQMLLEATPQQNHLKAGSSSLGQVTYQVIRRGNLMRMQLEKGEKKNEEELQKFQTI